MARSTFSLQVMLHLLYRNFHGQFGGVIVNPAADGGKRDGVDIFTAGEIQALAVTAGQQLRLTQITASPNRADRVIDTFDWQAEPGSGTHFAHRTATNLAAGFEQFRSRRTVDGAIHATATEEPLVGCIDDYIYMQPSDITEVYFDHSNYSNRGTNRQFRIAASVPQSDCCYCPIN